MMLLTYDYLPTFHSYPYTHLLYTLPYMFFEYIPSGDPPSKHMTYSLTTLLTHSLTYSLTETHTH